MIYFGEDTITALIDDADQRDATVIALRDHKLWEEIVVGLSDVTVKFDPDQISATDAKRKFLEALKVGPSKTETPADTITLPAHFDADNAPDMMLVAGALGIDPSTLPAWIMAREYSIAMMGFQPGFAYLQDRDCDALPNISRLNTPRQHVPAGSIGMLGQRACIYAQDGPGGWPIVGRVAVPLLRREATDRPFLLSCGLYVKFRDASD